MTDRRDLLTLLADSGEHWSQVQASLSCRRGPARWPEGARVQLRLGAPTPARRPERQVDFQLSATS